MTETCCVHAASYNTMTQCVWQGMVVSPPSEYVRGQRDLTHWAEAKENKP